MAWPIVAAVAVSAVSGMMANGAAQSAANAKKRAAEAAAKAFANIKIPTIEEQKIILQNPELVGQYTPEQVEAMQLGVSAMENVSADQSTKDAQSDALEGISEIAEGGYSKSDKATSREINREINQSAQARQKAILNAMASRGVLGSGMELAAQLQGEQQSIDQASKAGDNLTSQVQARALQALGKQGDLAGQMRGQQFGEQSDIARARDQINEFNLRNRQGTMNSNVAERNRAQQANLAAKQAIEDGRAANANKQNMYNTSLIRQRYQDEMQHTGAQHGMNIQAADAAAQGHLANAAMYQGLGSSAAGAFMGYGNMQNANEQADKDRANSLEVAKYGKK